MVWLYLVNFSHTTQNSAFKKSPQRYFTPLNYYYLFVIAITPSSLTIMQYLRAITECVCANVLVLNFY